MAGLSDQCPILLFLHNVGVRFPLLKVDRSTNPYYYGQKKNSTRCKRLSRTGINNLISKNNRKDDNSSLGVIQVVEKLAMPAIMMDDRVLNHMNHLATRSLPTGLIVLLSSYRWFSL